MFRRFRSISIVSWLSISGSPLSFIDDQTMPNFRSIIACGSQRRVIATAFKTRLIIHGMEKGLMTFMHIHLVDAANLGHFPGLFKRPQKLWLIYLPREAGIL